MDLEPAYPYLIQPIPEISPVEVIKYQLKALSNHRVNDLGIAAAYMFASPANKMYTGPLSRFIRMLKNPLYASMLNHVRAEFAEIVIEGNQAEQRVTLIEANQEATIYIFRLSKQQHGSYTGCWMTDSVLKS